MIKSVREIDSPEACPSCHESAVRQFVPRRTYLNGTSVENYEYNPGLGCIVKNSKHRKEIAKSRGLEEIGNEPLEKIHKKFDSDRVEKREKAYEQALKGWIGDGTG